MPNTQDKIEKMKMLESTCKSIIDNIHNLGENPIVKKIRYEGLVGFSIADALFEACVAINYIQNTLVFDRQRLERSKIDE